MVAGQNHDGWRDEALLDEEQRQMVSEELMTKYSRLVCRLNLYNSRQKMFAQGAFRKTFDVDISNSALFISL